MLTIHTDIVVFLFYIIFLSVLLMLQMTALLVLYKDFLLTYKIR